MFASQFELDCHVLIQVGMAKILQSKKEALGELRELSSEFERKVCLLNVKLSLDVLT